MPDIVPTNNDLNVSDFDTNIGEIVGFVGLKGIIKVTPSSNNPNLFLDIKNVLLRYAKEDIQATVKSVKLVKKQFQIQLNEYDSRTVVEKFRGAKIFTLEHQLRKLSKNEWWIKDLIGMDVYSTDGKLIGTVCDATGEHGEFLEIKKANDNKGQTVIISFVDQLFPVVDIESRRIEMKDLPGLFE